MNILFFSHYFPPEGNAPATRVHSMCKRWANTGHNITVITCAPNVPDGKVYEGYSNKIYQTEIIDGIKVIRVWTYIAPNKGTVRRILNFLSYCLSAFVFSLFIRNQDIIIATSPQFFCGWAGLLSAKLKRKAFILEIRDIWPESIVAVGAMHNRIILKILEYMEKKMYAGATHIVTVGKGYRKKLIEKGVPECKITIITNGIDTSIFSTDNILKIDIRKKYDLDDKFVCAYIGTVGMACGLDVVVRAAEKLCTKHIDDIRFLIVGDGAERVRLEKKVDEKGLSDIVLFTGRRPKSEIPAFIFSVDACLVHLRKTELFTTVLPSKIFEAMGMAKPVINAVKGQAAEIIINSQGGINIEAEDEEALINALLSLKNNPDILKTMGIKGKEYILCNYNIDTLAASYLNLIKTLLNR